MKKLLFILALVLAGAVAAQPGTLVAEGFNLPQGITVAADGSIWVADSGLGGDETMTLETPEGPAEVSYGVSARVVRIAPDGSQTVMATVPSLNLGFDIAGASDVAVLNGEVYITNGVWIEGAGPAREGMGAIMRLAPNGAHTVVDIWTFENALNPDGFIRESHPYRVTAGSDGWLWIADAGANTLLRANPANGRIELIATFDGLPIPFPNPARMGMMETDPVPTGVVEGPDGSVFVSFLPGAPLAPGMGKVVRVDAMGGVSDYAVNLTTPTDLAFGPDGALYATQFAVMTEQGPQPASGAVIRIGMGDGSVAVVEGLPFPTAIDFDDAGNAYVTINGVGAPGSGAVVRFDGLAAP